MYGYTFVLLLLTLPFLGRVLGQFLVAVFNVEWLPPMEAWQSGLLPYPLLLASQVAILVFQFELVRESWKGAGPLVQSRPRLGSWLKWFAALYFSVMFIRYVFTVWYPVEHFMSAAIIPIYFHWVLALYIYVLSRYYRGMNLPGKPGRQEDEFQ